MPNYTTPLPSPRGTNYECLYYDIVRKPVVMAMDAAIGGPPDDVDGGEDTEDKVRQLLAGKLSPEDLDALCALIFPDDSTPMPAQDRRRQAHDGRRGLALDALMRRRVAEGAQVRARRVIAETAELTKRFPALKNARVVG